MKHILLAGLCLIMLAACGCQSNEAPESSSLLPDDNDLVQAAEATYMARLRATKGGNPGSDQRNLFNVLGRWDQGVEPNQGLHAQDQYRRCSTHQQQNRGRKVYLHSHLIVSA